MVKIISDSTCDLSPELIAKYDIDILPLHILLGEDEYEDGRNITPQQIYDWSDAHKTTPKTSAPSLAEAIDLFRPYIEEKREIVCFSISGSMSTSGNVMRLAAEELEASDLVTVIDSANLSTGIGLLVIEAAIMAEKGQSATEIAATIESLKPNVRASFVVDTLTYLYRGGRCNAVSAMAGGVLRLHPKIVVENGAMDASKKYRGKINSVIMSYVKDMEEDLKSAKPERVFITHSGCDRTTVDAVRSYLESLGIFHEILETRAGGVVSSHCGPGTLGVLFSPVQINKESYVQEDSHSRCHRCSQTDLCQTCVRLNTHKICQRQTYQKCLDQTLCHDPDSLVISIEITNHTEQNCCHKCLRCKTFQICKSILDNRCICRKSTAQYITFKQNQYKYHTANSQTHTDSCKHRLFRTFFLSCTYILGNERCHGLHQ